MKYGITAFQAMTKKPIVVSPDETLAGAGEMMLKKEVGSLVVVENGKLAGMITEKDLIKALVQSRKDPTKVKVKEVMARKMVTIPPETDLYDIAKIMNEQDIRRLPVVDKNEELLGIVTEKDLLKIQPSVIDVLIEKIKIREPKFKPLSEEIPGVSGICEICSNYSDSLVESKGAYICDECAEEAAEK